MKVNTVKKFIYSCCKASMLAVTIMIVLATICPSAVLADDRPAIDLDPREGPVGTKVIVVLNNYEPGVVDISFDAEANIIETCSTDDNGNAYTYFIVEEYPQGEYKIWATDDENREYIVFKVIPEIEADTYKGYVGDEVVINGTGFAAKSEVSIRFDNDEVTIDKTDENGCFAGATFTVPESANGIHTIKVVDEESNYTTANFTTQHTISISGTDGKVNTGVTVSGTGFDADADITVTLANEEVSISKSDNNGSFSDTFVVPAMVQGTYRIKISDGANNSYADFSIAAVASINPAEGHVGSDITITGSGYAANSNITVKYDNEKMASAKTETSGSFEINFTTPVSEHGDHTVTISDSTTTTDLTFTIESDPPPTPRLLLPANSSKVSGTPNFSWEAVTDPSGVTYVLQVASDENFSTIVIEKTGLDVTEVTLTEGESLQPRKKEEPYFWRVRAIDRASNKGQWSSPGSFYMGLILATPPGWVQWGLTGLGITLFGFLFGTFLNRLRRLAIGD